MRFLGTVLAAALLLVLVYLFAGWMVDGYFGGNIVPDGAVPDAWAAPNSWGEWRDITFVFMSLFWLLSGLMLLAVLTAVFFLVITIRRMLRESVTPAVDSLKESLDQIKGTAEFAGETVVSPIIRVYSVVKGVRAGVSAVTNLPGFVRGRRKKKGRKK